MNHNQITRTIPWVSSRAKAIVRLLPLALLGSILLFKTAPAAAAWGCNTYFCSAEEKSSWRQYYALFELPNNTYYWQKYPDVRNSGIKEYTGQGGGQTHWVERGMYECRSPNENFDPRAYLKRYSDLARAFGADNCKDASIHWINSGQREGRNGKP